MSPLKPCIYALLMKCDGEQAGCVCLGERIYLYIVCMLQCSYIDVDVPFPVL